MSELAENQPRRMGRPTLDEATALREVVLDQTLELLVVQGAESLSMNELARRAGVTKRTVYRQFGSKAGLISAVIDREVDRLQATAQTPTEHSDDLLENLHGWARHLFKYVIAPDTRVFTNYINFIAATNPDLQERQRVWHSRIIQHLCGLIENAQCHDLLVQDSPMQLSLLLLDLLAGPSNRKRFHFADDEAFGHETAEGFFDRRWTAFYALAGTNKVPRTKI